MGFSLCHKPFSLACFAYNATYKISLSSIHQFLQAVRNMKEKKGEDPNPQVPQKDLRLIICSSCSQYPVDTWLFPHAVDIDGG